MEIKIKNKMILYRTKYYAAADIINNAVMFAKKRKNLINRARKEGNHSFADALQNATDSEFAAYLQQRDKATVLAKTENSDVKNYVGGVKTARQNYNSLLDKNGNITWAENGEATHNSYAARRLVGPDNTNIGYRVVNGKPVWVDNQNIEHLGQSSSLKKNLKSEYRNQNDGDGRDMWDWTKTGNGGSTARYLGDFEGSDRMINQINKGNGHYSNFVDSNSKLGQVMSGKGSYSQLGADESLISSVKNRQAAAAKAEQERAAKAAEEQRRAAEQAKIQQQQAEEKARAEAAAKAREDQKRAEEEARKRRQQAEAASREKEEQRRQEQLNRAKDRSRRDGLYTGLGIAGGTAALGAGAYYLANRNKDKQQK